MAANTSASMNDIFYYSSNCAICKEVISILRQENINLQAICFVSVDNCQSNNGTVYGHLGNGHPIPVPPNVTHVPALLLLTQGGRIYYKNDIISVLRALSQSAIRRATGGMMQPQPATHSYPPTTRPAQAAPPSRMQPPQYQEPMAYTPDSSVGTGGVSSDTFSTIDAQSCQSHGYVSVDAAYSSVSFRPDEFKTTVANPPPTGPSTISHFDASSRTDAVNYRRNEDVANQYNQSLISSIQSNRDNELNAYREQQEYQRRENGLY